MFPAAMTKFETIEIESQVVEHVRELARQRGGSLSEAIDAAVLATLARDGARDGARDAALGAEGGSVADKAGRRAAALETLEAFWALPHAGETLTDADLYDKDGLPR